MKALRFAAIMLLAGGAMAVAPQAAHAQVNQLDAEINISPDKVTPIDNGVRLQIVLMGIPGTSQRIDGIDLNIGSKLIKATDIDGVDFERHFQFEDTGVQVIEVDFPFKGTLPRTATLTFHTEKGDITAPARQ